MRPVHAAYALIAFAALIVLFVRTAREGESLAAYGARQLRLALG